jgi:hypothetical protein
MEVLNLSSMTLRFESLNPRRSSIFMFSITIFFSTAVINIFKRRNPYPAKGQGLFLIKLS